MTARLFEGHYSLNWQGITPNINSAIDALSDSELLGSADEALVARITDQFRLKHPAIEHESETSVERGGSASDPGSIVYKHAVTDPSTLLRHNLSGMIFPAPRHRLEGTRLVLSYPAEQGAESAKKRHESDIKIFDHNVAAACRNADEFNGAVEKYVSSTITRAKAAADSRRKLAGEF